MAIIIIENYLLSQFDSRQYMKGSSIVGEAQKVVSVSLNSAIDQTVSIPNFRAGALNRVQSSQIDAGGKGVNVAAFLADFGQPVTITGFLGADNDDIFCRLFERKRIVDCCVRIAGKTRISFKVSDEVLHQTTDINFPGETPSPANLARLFEILVELSTTHQWFILSGSIPRGVSASVYADIMRSLPDAKIVLDTSGEGFRQALPASPWLIKPNLAELSEFAGKVLDSPEVVLEQARAILSRYNIHTVVVSMGKDGAMFVESKEMVWASPPVVEVKSTVGAGDAMVAGIVVGKMRGLGLAECARLATAFSVTAISQIGSGLPSIEAVQSASERVTIRDLTTGSHYDGSRMDQE
jgi:1-phosphofructokinase